MRFIGLDLSLTASGVCVLEGYKVLEMFTAKTKGLTGSRRLVAIRTMVINAVKRWQDKGPPIFAAIEGYNYGANTPGCRELAELGGVIRVALYEEYGEGSYIDVAPALVKKFGAGTARADKAAMIRAAEKMGIHPADDDQADAYHLACIAQAFRRESMPTTAAQIEVLGTLNKKKMLVKQTRSVVGLVL